VDYRYVLAATLFEEFAGLEFGKAGIPCLDYQEESIIRRAAEALPIEDRVIPARQTVHEKHREKGGEGGEMNEEGPNVRTVAVSNPVIPPPRTAALSHDLPSPIASSIP
jgi:hypothetical protein